MRHRFYPTVVDRSRATNEFTVSVPDLGVTTTMPDSEDPYLAAIEIATDEIERRRLENEDAPEPTALAPHARRRPAPYMVFTVPIAVRRDYVRVSLALRPDLVRRIDDEANALGMTRSAYVSQLAVEALQAA